MERWRTVWRRGFAPQFSTPALRALLAACRNNDKRLLQGFTVPISPSWSDPCECGCAIAFCGITDSLDKSTCGIEKFFADAVSRAEFAREFLNWFDDNPRETVLRRLANEIEFNLRCRGES